MAKGDVVEAQRFRSHFGIVVVDVFQKIDGGARRVSSVGVVECADEDVGDCADELVPDGADEVGVFVPLLRFKLERARHVGIFKRWGVGIVGGEDGERWLDPIISSKVLEFLRVAEENT